MKLKEIKKFYEWFHSNKILNPKADLMQAQRCDYLRFLIKNITGKFLVIGCGSEEEMGILNKNCDGIGIDISEEAVKKSKAKYPQFEYYVANATNLHFEKNSFDCVICSEVIEHIPDDEKFLSEVKRVLKNNGIFIVTTPNWLSWYGLARKIAEGLFKKPVTSDDQPIDNWSTPSSLKRKLKKYGFEINFLRGLWYFPPTGKGKNQIPWRITLPIAKLFYPFEVLFRRILPWYGHMILFKTRLIKS
ncbi:MAG: methyltransferase domain-containing protein [Candidatus Shapirobacteria bacterium]|nr:methyltransferase domain-containing protein [Candidatus Shapirobacteria bacterium]